MRTIKLLGALVAVLAFSALGVAATASAAEVLWRWLPGSVGETFKGEQPEKGALVTKAHTITCAKATVLLSFELEGKVFSSELTGTAGGKESTLELVLIHFEGCKVDGLFAANTLGDSSGIILVHLEVHNCLISKAEKKFGLLILPLPIHIEIPVAGLLVTINEKVLFIAELKAGATKLAFTLSATQAGGVQGIKKCEGGTEESLKSKTDNEAEEQAGLETKTNLEFDMTKDKEGEEMME